MASSSCIVQGPCIGLVFIGSRLHVHVQGQACIRSYLWEDQPCSMKYRVACPATPCRTVLMCGVQVRGGGLGSFNLSAVGPELVGVSMQHQLAIPPYFSLIIRTFSVLEGIALKARGFFSCVLWLLNVVC
jgi:hypothetical protein